MSIEVRPQPYFATVSQPRPTPVKTPFSQVLATSAAGLVRGVELGLNVLPGGSAIALAVRGGAGGASVRSGVGVSAGGMNISAGAGGGMGLGSGTGGVGSAEGPSAGAGTGVSGTGGEPGVEDSLRNAQEMNMYYLQIQEQVNAQNRTFSTLSNVLKAEHDTVKTAIGNIR